MFTEKEMIELLEMRGYIVKEQEFKIYDTDYSGNLYFDHTKTHKFAFKKNKEFEIPSSNRYRICYEHEYSIYELEKVFKNELYNFFKSNWLNNFNIQ